MWRTISEISSLITCILFITYLAGRIWRIWESRCTRSEDIKFLPVNPYGDYLFGESDDYSLDEYDDESGNVIYADKEGEQFSIASRSGIRKIEVYEINNRLGEGGKLITYSKKNLKCKQKFEDYFKPVYIRCNLGELFPVSLFIIQRMDYSVISFELFQSKRNGMPVKENCKCKTTLRTILYYLCE